nr:3912_t:CDS:2 [Entrophospora candida]
MKSNHLEEIVIDLCKRHSQDAILIDKSIKRKCKLFSRHIMFFARYIYNLRLSDNRWNLTHFVKMKHFDKLSSSHYWTYEPLENILPSKKITNTSNNTTKSNIRNNSNSNIKPSKNNNKSTITTPKIEKETIIPFSNYLGLTGQPPTEKFDVADHYWTNLPLEAILPSKSKYKNTKNKKNSSFTPSSINLNLFTKYERLMNKNKR